MQRWTEYGCSEFSSNRPLDVYAPAQKQEIAVRKKHTLILACEDQNLKLLRARVMKTQMNFKMAWDTNLFQMLLY